MPRLTKAQMAELAELLASDPEFAAQVRDALLAPRGPSAGSFAPPQPSADPALLPDSPAPPSQPSVIQPQRVLDRSVISTPLLQTLKDLEAKPELAGEHLALMIELNASRVTIQNTDDSTAAPKDPTELLRKAIEEKFGVRPNARKSALMPQYVFVRLTPEQIDELVTWDKEQAEQAAKVASSSPPRSSRDFRHIHRIWPDFKVKATMHRTGATIKAEAARVAFAAAGRGIVWAVMDSGIQGDHPHFLRHGTLNHDVLKHQSYIEALPDPLSDEFGHGTHVAGVIAGEWRPERQLGPQERKDFQEPFVANIAHRAREEDDVTYQALALDHLSGIAPLCKLVSYKVLDEAGEGEASNLMLAIADVQRVNEYGKELRIHGVNISIGYPFDPEWFACGQSPLCVAVNRLVKSGVVVVVAAGNSGYGTLSSDRGGVVKTALALTINDPGNADLAITVGAAHRESPHTYGVSYFSSKGPTGDGRLKPDLVAPGERILSCAAGGKRASMERKAGPTHYLEDSGTSMATPHVSGAAAAFLSVQREFIGRPEALKKILMDTATDLGRDRSFQGAGMVDVMRAIQSV